MSLECVRCGNCCPDTCPSKQRNSDNTVTCTIHPSIIGEDNRGLFCDTDTFFLFLQGVACQAYFPPEDYPDLQTETLTNGQIIQKSFPLDITDL
jgi:hypothetical protein